jgi:ketohexokinase
MLYPRAPQVYSSAAYSPSEVVDTLGAGDTFNAAVLHCLSNNERNLQDTLNYACKLAGFKCGVLGYEGLRSFSIK